jgi:5-methylcytosine-specific restriction enzyme subunit McrC
MTQPRVIELTEYVPLQFAREEITVTQAEALWRNYGNQIIVESLPFKADHPWCLTSQGWVGYIPLTSEFGVALQPKVGLANLFRMLEYAYNLRSFRFLEALIDCQSLAEFYENLANILARRVLDRNRTGLYRAYLANTDRLPYVRGRLDMHQSSQRPGQVKLECHYQEHTPDIEDNQILAWTLFQIARSGMCTARVLPTVRRAYQAYQPMHALCRFFLEQSGPSHRLGDRTMLPFLVDMARLYERFVAEWLKANLPANFRLKVQETVHLGETHPLHFEIDLVMYEANTGTALCVLDTKYKVPEEPAHSDIWQVVAYAKLKKCHEAILVYPVPLPRPVNTMWDDIRVRSLTFSLDGDLEQAGQTLRESLLSYSTLRL